MTYRPEATLFCIASSPWRQMEVLYEPRRIEEEERGSGKSLMNKRKTNALGIGKTHPTRIESNVSLDKSGIQSYGPARFVRTALQIEVATFPPAADVSIMHILTVVGRQVMINRPSTNAGGIRFGKTFVKRYLRGKPIINGHNPNITSPISPFSLILETASVNSEVCKERPERRKIMPTPYFPMKSSGRKMPPLTPSCQRQKNYLSSNKELEIVFAICLMYVLTDGNNFANVTATNIPTRKKFVLTNFFICDKICGSSLSIDASLPARIEVRDSYFGNTLRASAFSLLRLFIMVFCRDCNFAWPIGTDAKVKALRFANPNRSTREDRATLTKRFSMVVIMPSRQKCIILKFVLKVSVSSVIGSACVMLWDATFDGLDGMAESPFCVCPLSASPLFVNRWSFFFLRTVFLLYRIVS